MIRSIQIIDSLNIGGAERMAVNIANSLSDTIESHICVTRKEGVLKDSLKDNVSYFFLDKKSVFDIKALVRLKAYIIKNNINIVHAHGTSFFFCVILKLVTRNLKLIWHDHYGNRVKNTGIIKLLILKLCSLNFSIIYCVNNDLKAWAIKNLYSKRVKFISNYPTINFKNETKLKGFDGKRILCLANLKEPKNHQLLFSAFNQLVKEGKDWTLHCIGTIYNDDYFKNLKLFIKDNKLENHVFLYGAREDTSHIISQSNIGVLSSESEGMPMALLEYGIGELPVITTDVGFCKELISNKSFGLLVPSNNQNALILALKIYISDAGYRKTCAEKFHKKVKNNFSETNMISNLLNDYKVTILE